jgi:hypothetical protein
MKNRILALAALVGVTYTLVQDATSELRTPLSLIYNFGPFHYRLEPDTDDCWYFNIFNALYARRADNGFGNQKGTSTATTSLSSLFFGADAFTANQSFAGGSGSVNGNVFVSTSLLTPQFYYTERGIVGGFHIERSFEDCWFDMGGSWYAGLRAAIPFKNIKIEPEGPVENASLGNLVLNDIEQRVDPAIPVLNGTPAVGANGVPVTITGNTGAGSFTWVSNPNGNVRSVYAYRLDLLTSLNFPGTTSSVVHYGTGASDHTTIASTDITTVPNTVTETIPGVMLAAGQASNGGTNPFTIGTALSPLTFPQNDTLFPGGTANTAARQVYAIRSADGTIANLLNNDSVIKNTTMTGTPASRGGLNGTILMDGEISIARDLNLQGGNLPDGGLLAGDGSGGANGQRLAFDPGTNYSALAANPAAQRQLFIIPASLGDGQLLPDAAALQSTINFIIADSAATAGTNSASTFLASNGISINPNQKVNGVGDLDTDFYLGYEYNDCWMGDLYSELTLGIRWPTGKRDRNPGFVYYQTTGNNGHYEVKGQFDLGIKPWAWLGLHTDFSYSHVCRSIERRAAAFTGATIRNIGPTVDARVSYNYWVFHADATFFQPDNCGGLGLVVSYELYSKTRDHLEFLSPTATDFNGVTQTLDSSILTYGTNSLAQKVRGEMFHRWDFCELFIGASRVFAGRNVFKETEAHIGLGISF